MLDLGNKQVNGKHIMTLIEAKELIPTGLSIFSQNDFFLITENVSERAIAHKIGEYLQTIFPYYHVDCEYNRNNEHESRSKRLNILKDRYEAVKNKEIAGESIDISVYPDIIIHRRGTNNHNLIVIEIKKTTNTDDEALDFDIEKLRSFTDQSDRNNLKYQFGVFLLLDTVVHKANPDNYIVQENWFVSDNLV